MPRGWQELGRLVATHEEWIDGPFEKNVETRRARGVREKQEKHFGGPMLPKPLQFLIHCESVDPIPNLNGHLCPDDLADIVRHGRRPLTVKDRRIENAPTVLRINRVRYRCRRCNMTFLEYLPDIHEGHRITKRFHRDLAVGSLKRPFAEVASLNSIKPDLVETIFHEYRAAMMDNYQADLPRVIAVDETKLLGEVRFVCSDLKGRRIIDITNDTRPDIEACFAKHSYHGSVQVWVQDMSAKFRSIAHDIFPQADVVVDRFHVIQHITKAVDKVRSAFTHRLPRDLQAALNQDMKVLVTNQSSLSQKRLRLLEEIKDHSPQIRRAHRLKEEFQTIYAYNSQKEAKYALRDWADKLNDKAFQSVDTHFLKIRGTTWNDWQTEILNYWKHPYTNAFSERMNRCLKEINRYANGLTFETLRDKAILKYGHFHKMKEIADFNLMGLTEGEVVAETEFRVWKGFSADSLARSLRAGMFEGHPPENRERPVVLPDGQYQGARDAEWDDIERAWETGPQFEVITSEMAAEYATPIRRNGIRNAFSDWRLRPPDPRQDMEIQPKGIHPNSHAMRHYLRRGRGHGRGRGIMLDSPRDPDYESVIIAPRQQRADMLGQLFDI
ncbi:ISL3 family transposase [Methylobacterium sp. WL8]|uniref:ISL3 family transposase n=1 Tax=Methylobacterium sp. WL8 TaxID=2603899 RepID=UPI001650A507|nr:ISL3 family transposase [Methylobacterium sp. WL8]